MAEDGQQFTQFMLKTCATDRRQNSKAAVINLLISPRIVTGSVAELYIKPAFSCIGDTDIMIPDHYRIALPTGKHMKVINSLLPRYSAETKHESLHPVKFTVAYPSENELNAIRSLFERRSDRRTHIFHIHDSDRVAYVKIHLGPYA